MLYLKENKMVNKEVISAGNDKSKKIVFIMGWGNSLQDPWLKWLKDKAQKQKWNLLIIEIPCEFDSFNSVLEELISCINNFGCDILLSHSMGALFGRLIHVDSSIRKIFLSPFWRIPKNTLILGSYPLSRLIIYLLKWCKTPILYRNFKDQDIGIIDLPQNVPNYISPSTMHEVMTAQDNLPPFESKDTIIYCPTDQVIDTSKLSGIEYSGGHLAFTVAERDAIFQKIVDLLITKQ